MANKYAKACRLKRRLDKLFVQTALDSLIGELLEEKTPFKGISKKYSMVFEKNSDSISKADFPETNGYKDVLEYLEQNPFLKEKNYSGNSEKRLMIERYLKLTHGVNNVPKDFIEFIDNKLRVLGSVRYQNKQKICFSCY
jgi:hypothetical protein